MIVCARICLGEGAGVHQWNVTVQSFIGVAFVRFLIQIAFVELQTDLELVAIYCSNILRPGHLLDQDDSSDAIRSFICYPQSREPLHVVLCLDHYCCHGDLFHHRHCHHHLRLYSTGSELEPLDQGR